MNTTTLVTAYRNWLNATATMQGELQTALRGGTLSAATVAELAEAHAEHYGCYLLEKDGAWRFYTSDEAVSANRHEAAQRQWDRTVAKYQKPRAEKRGGARERNRTSVAEKWMAAFHKLEAKDRKEVLRLLKGEGLI